MLVIPFVVAIRVIMPGTISRATGTGFRASSRSRLLPGGRQFLFGRERRDEVLRFLQRARSGGRWATENGGRRGDQQLVSSYGMPRSRICGVACHAQPGSMSNDTMNRRSFLQASTSALVACSLPPRTQTRSTPLRPRPSPSQLAWQRDELALFLHFGVNTFTDREWGDGHEDPSIFSPSALDARQWARCRASRRCSSVNPDSEASRRLLSLAHANDRATR